MSAGRPSRSAWWMRWRWTSPRWCSGLASGTSGRWTASNCWRTQTWSSGATGCCTCATGCAADGPRQPPRLRRRFLYLRPNGVLGSTYSPGPTLISVPGWDRHSSGIIPTLGTFSTRFSELGGTRDGGDVLVRGQTGEQTDQESRSEATEPRVDFLLPDAVGHGRTRIGGKDAREEVREVHGRGTGSDEGARPRAEGRSAEGGWGTRRAREDRRDAGTGPRHGRAAP